MAKRKKRRLLRIIPAKFPWFSFARIVLLAALGVALAVWGAARAFRFHNAPMLVPKPPATEPWPPPSTIEIDLSNPASSPLPSPSTSR